MAGSLLLTSSHMSDGEKLEAKRQKTGKVCKVAWKGSWACEFGQNIKKVGTQSYGRFDAYKQAKTISDALKAGASLRDLDFEYSKGTLVCAEADADAETPAQCHAALVDSQDGGKPCHAALDSQDAGKNAPGKRRRDRRLVVATPSQPSVLQPLLGPAEQQAVPRAELSVQTEVFEGMECKDMFTQTEISALEWMEVCDVATQTPHSSTESELADLTHETYRLRFSADIVSCCYAAAIFHPSDQIAST